MITTTVSDAVLAGGGASITRQAMRCAIQHERRLDDTFPSFPVRTSSMLGCLPEGHRAHSPVATAQTEW